MPAIEISKDEAKRLLEVLEHDVEDLVVEISGPHPPPNRVDLEKERRFLLSVIHRIELSTAADESLCS